MLEVKAKPFFRAVHTVGWLESMIRFVAENDEKNRDEVMKAKARGEIKKHLSDLKESLTALGANNSVGETDFILKRLRTTDLKWTELKGLLEGLTRLVGREIEGAKLFALEPIKGPYYGLAAEVFGMEAVVAFPRAEYDLEEAGKCVALARNTACVFHLMRAMETVLQILCGRLGVANVDKRWGFLLQDIDSAIKMMADTDDRAKWSLTRSNLWHVKETWRNDTMHPGDKYTDAEARDVLEAVKVFVRSLSTLAAGA